MPGEYDQLGIMTNHNTTYESYQSNDLTGVAFTMCNNIEIA